MPLRLYVLSVESVASMLLRLRVTKIKKLHILQNLRCELSFAVPGSEANLCYMFGGLGICEAKCASSKRLNNDSIFTSHKFTHVYKI